ncbi:mechanosensitive ion channel family protein [Lichenifustis flavocetrariae]|uniref:Small-conductance mechanosensitive channel n=1 Tax=Lichenifustis flavocetrariae TaxID=2949735 RepID=A0AA41YVL0_9HYPH|nr:mechanosensitive ion channel family protein [Lichenifustis flavocetrariae]MCW6507738.1 mechanosensitive ion channel family protein [Lichenifustis flavocetrariae]
MTIWITTAWTTIVLMIVVSLSARRRPIWLRIGLSLFAIILLSLAMAPLVGSPLQPQFPADVGAFVAFSERAFVASWWLLVARIVIATGQLALGINHQRHAARLLSDLAAGAIYLGALLAVIDLGFGVSIAGLLATSGIIAIVLGLALQSTLSDLFSGVAIGIDRPFGVGDLVLIEGAAEGRVIETNWRSTRIATTTNDVATVPNSVVAKARITNRSIPSEAHLATIKIVIDASVPPKDAMAMLRASALNAALVPPSPPPSIVCVDLRGEGATYEMQFSIPITEFGAARSDLLAQIARHARYNGIPLARQDGARLPSATVPDLLHLLDDVPILKALGEDERGQLASRLVRHAGDAGYTLFTQGGSVASMFVIAQGAFDVSRDIDGHRRRLGTIGPGDYFGELALLTGSPNAATVTALTPFVAYEVGKAMIAPALQSNPEVLHALERAASNARALLDRTVAAQACPEPAATVHLIDRIRSFFSVSGLRDIHLKPTDPV